MAPPSEFDLRAALSEGEGEGGRLDVDSVIAAGHARRAQRRSRLLTTAAVVAIVAGGAVGVTQLAGSGSSGNTSDSVAAGGAEQRNADSSAGGQGGSAYGAVGGGQGVPAPMAPTSSSAKALASISCPSKGPDYLLAGGGGNPAFGSSTRLFTRPVSSVVVCAYGTTFDAMDSSVAQPGRLELAGAAATSLAQSMERAPLVASASCAAPQPERHSFAVIGVAPSGRRSGPVVQAVTGCDQVTTNGTAVRYNWTPPPDLKARLYALTPVSPPDATPSPSS